MKTRENKAMRFASVLLVLTLLATSLTAGTFAKYVTSANGSAEARVAKFGVDVRVDATKVFGKQYGADNAIVNADDTGITVQVNSADTEKNVVAPGTKGAMTFEVSGNPETSVKLEMKLDNIDEIKLNAGEYKNGSDQSLNVGGEGYYPVTWTLKKDNTIVTDQDSKPYAGVTLTKINEYFTTISQENYAPNTFEAAVKGSYELSWSWDSGVIPPDNNSGSDTILGDLAAGAEDITKSNESGAFVKIEKTDYNLKEAFNFSISVTQVD